MHLMHTPDDNTAQAIKIPSFSQIMCFPLEYGNSQINSRLSTESYVHDIYNNNILAFGHIIYVWESL